MRVLILQFVLLMSVQAVAQDIYPTPRSPDSLIANFERAINERNSDEYARTLHESFVFEFVPRDRGLAAPEGKWDRGRELEAMEKMLEDRAGDAPVSRVMLAAKKLDLVLSPRGEWENSPCAPEYWTRTYHAVFTIVYEDDSRDFVSRRQSFTVVALRSEHDLRPAEFKMIYWREHAAEKRRVAGMVAQRF